MPAAAELDLPLLVANTQHVRQLRPLPRFPAVTRDLSFVVGDATRYDALDDLVRKLNLPDLEAVTYVTTYRGKQIEKGRKVVTIALVFRSAIATLMSEQVEGAVQQVVRAAQEKLGATLRT
jgi:phenylalanyl-tRNA synthetase beta chain